MNIVGLIIRVVISAFAVGIAAFLTPGMSIQGGLWTLIIAAIVMGVLDWAIHKLTKIDASPFGRGIVGFIVAAAILYITGFLVEGFNVSLLGAIIGAFVLGIVDALIPGERETI